MSSDKPQSGHRVMVIALIAGLLVGAAYLWKYPVTPSRPEHAPKTGAPTTARPAEQAEPDETKPAATAEPPAGPAEAQDKAAAPAQAGERPDEAVAAQPAARPKGAAKTTRSEVSRIALQLRLAEAQMESAKGVMAGLCPLRGDFNVKHFEGDAKRLVRDDIGEIERICGNFERIGSENAKGK